MCIYPVNVLHPSFYLLHLNPGMMKIKKIRQRDATDCGPACLAAVAASYGKHLPVSLLRQYAGTDRNGTNMAGLVRASEKIGFMTRPGKGNLTTLQQVKLPAIVHLRPSPEIQHYSVVYRVSQNFVTLMDPGRGTIHRQRCAAFCHTWSGILLVLYPGEKFQPGGHRNTHFRRLFRMLAPCRGLMITAVAAAVLCAFLGLSLSFYLRQVIDHVLPRSNSSLLNKLSLAMVGIIFLEVITGWGKDRIGMYLGRYVDQRLISGYYQHLLALPQAFFDTMKKGDMLNRVNNALKIRAFVNNILLSVPIDVLAVTVSLMVMLICSWKMSLVVLWLLPFQAVLWYTNNQRQVRSQRQLLEKSAALQTHLVESIGAASFIKQSLLERHMTSKTVRQLGQLMNALYANGRRQLAVGSLADLTTKLAVILAIWWGGTLVLGHQLSAGNLFFFYVLTGYFTSPVMSLVHIGTQVQETRAAADRLFEIMDLEPEDHSPAGNAENPIGTGHLCFQNVWFAYGAAPPVLKELSLQIRCGTVTAIVGENGSGKSTLVSLLLRLYPVTRGKITAGGTALEDFQTAHLRRQIAVVPQQTDLFAISILENITLGEPDADIGKVMHVARLLGMHELIEKMPRGYDTILEEQGMNLSGGQRQRLAIARALYRDPQVLILDEATAALDSESERCVWKALAWFKKSSRTIVLITHQLKNAWLCDHILVLKEGRIAEDGSPAELMQKEGGLFAHMLKAHLN